MGLLWSFLNPVFMLMVYSFVFSVVFKARWAGGDESHTQFAVVLFAGMIVHTLFAEVLNRAPGIILSNVNYVKKVVFPLEILAVVSVGAALFHMPLNHFQAAGHYALFKAMSPLVVEVMSCPPLMKPLPFGIPQAPP